MQTPLAQTPGFSAHSFTSARGKGCRPGGYHCGDPRPPVHLGGSLRLGYPGRAQERLSAPGRGAHLLESRPGRGLPRGQRGRAPEKQLGREGVSERESESRASHNPRDQSVGTEATHHCPPEDTAHRGRPSLPQASCCSSTGSWWC